MVTGVGKTMSTYEKTINRLKGTIRLYQKNYSRQKGELLKANTFINKLRDDGRLSKDEIEVYFKK